MLDISTTFPSAKQSGDGHMAKCPAHEDRTASLSINTGDDGRVLLRCHGGCDVDDILQAVHLERRDLFPQNGNGHRAREIVASYDYRTLTGDLLFQVVRYAPKDFRQRRPDGNGGYLWSVKGLDRVVYRLPEIQGQQAVFIVEGEKDADRLASLGLPVTTCAGGAEKWSDRYAEQLTSAGIRRVAIVPDNDEAGRKHAEQVAASCEAAGLAAKIVTLPDVPPKGDVSDYLDAGHTKADLTRLAKAAPRYTPAREAPARAPVITWLKDVKPEAVSWLWPGRMARGKYQVIVGDPDLGKTTIALDCAARLSIGGTWPDGTPCPQGKSLILRAEDGIADTIRPRIDTLGGDPSQVAVLEAIRDDRGQRPLNLKNDLDILVAAIEQTQPTLVIIDPISAYLGDTNSHKDSEVRGLLSPIKDILEKHKVTLLAVAHLNKNQQQAVIHRTSGAVAFVAAARLGWVVASHPDDPERWVMAMFKHNLCAKAPSLTYELDGGGVTWDVAGGDITAETLLQSAGPEDRGEQRDAMDFLQDLLEDGSPMKSTDVMRAANREGISSRSVWRAKRRLGIRASKQGFGKDGFWLWSLDPCQTP